MQLPKNGLKLFLYSTLLLGWFFLCAFLSYTFFSFREVRVKPVGNLNGSFGVSPTKSPSGEGKNVILLGYGGGGHEGSLLTDALVIIRIDLISKRAYLISLPRDTWVKIPSGGEEYKINNAFALGVSEGDFSAGFAKVKEVIAMVTGAPIDYVVAVDFAEFKNIIDTLGGVEVEVPVAFDDYFYPIKGRENDTCGKSPAEIADLHQLYSDTELHHQFECRYEHIHFDTGATLMDGGTALKFVRSRASSQHGGDFARSQRQVAVLSGIKEKLISVNALTKVDELFEQLGGLVKTDLDLVTLKNLLEVFGDPGLYTTSFIGLTTDNVFVAGKSANGQFILIPKEGNGVWSGVQNYIAEQVNSN